LSPFRISDARKPQRQRGYFIVAAGEAEPLDRCRPLFDDLGQKTFVVDRFPPKANLVKLSGNFPVASMIECLGEAVALIRKAGVDPTQFLAILTGSLFAALVYETYGELILEERYRPAGFTMPLGLKDMRGVLAAAGAKNVPMPVASLLRDHFITAMARGKADLDWSALARLARRECRPLTGGGADSRVAFGPTTGSRARVTSAGGPLLPHPPALPCSGCLFAAGCGAFAILGSQKRES